MLNWRLSIKFGYPSVCHFWWNLIYKLHYIMHEHAACCGLGPAAVSCSAACTRPGNTNSMEYKQDWRLARCRGAVLTRTIDHGIVLTEHKLPIFSFFSYFHILNKLTSLSEPEPHSKYLYYILILKKFSECCVVCDEDEMRCILLSHWPGRSLTTLTGVSGCEMWHENTITHNAAVWAST